MSSCGNDDTNGHEWVDLGLPSGTLWATCNVGADKPEEFGNCFSWGETEPKGYYSERSYSLCNDSYDKIIKYCNNPKYGYNGFKDKYTELRSDDDAATVNWGSGWCTPTKEQWLELKQNTTNVWINQNGVNGRLLTAKNGRTLFLPAAGSRWNNDLICPDYYGCYWSKTLEDIYPDACCLLFGPDERDLDLCSGNRCRGLSVRPVRK